MLYGKAYMCVLLKISGATTINRKFCNPALVQGLHYAYFKIS